MNVKETLIESVAIYKKTFFQLIGISLIICVMGLFNELVSLGSQIDSGNGISTLLLFTTLFLWYLKIRIGMVMNHVVFMKISNTPISSIQAFKESKKYVMPYVWNQLLVLLVLAVPLAFSVVIQSAAMPLIVKGLLGMGSGILIAVVWSHVYFAPIDAQLSPSRKNHLKWSYQMVRANRLNINLILFLGCFVFYAPFFLYNPMDFGVVVTPMTLFINGVIECFVFLFAMPFTVCVALNLYNKEIRKSVG